MHTQMMKLSRNAESDYFGDRGLALGPASEVAGAVLFLDLSSSYVGV